MTELKRIVDDLQSAFAESSYPADFLAAYDQMECLASHSGRETFLEIYSGPLAKAAGEDRQREMEEELED